MIKRLICIGCCVLKLMVMMMECDDDALNECKVNIHSVSVLTGWCESSESKSKQPIK